MTEKTVTVVNRIGLVGLAVYLGIGFACYALLGGTGGIFHWDNAWLYGWVLAWPIALCIYFFLWALLIGGVCTVLWFLFYWAVSSKWFQTWRINRVRDSVLRGVRR